MTINVPGAPPQAPSPQEMLEHYRKTATPEMKLLVESFTKMSIRDRDELLYYGILYETSQLAGILRWIQSVSSGPPPGSPILKH